MPGFEVLKRPCEADPEAMFYLGVFSQLLTCMDSVFLGGGLASEYGMLCKKSRGGLESASVSVTLSLSEHTLVDYISDAVKNVHRSEIANLQIDL